MKRFKSYISEVRGEIYCDMDGVLVDLMGWFCKNFNPPTCSPPGVDKYFEAEKPKMVKTHPHMYRDLPWMPDGKMLWQHISKYNPNILSAYSKAFPNSPQDKLHWIHHNLKPSPNRKHIVLRNEKQLHALKPDGTPNILIDDWIKNIKEWEAKGGIAIHHKSAAETIAKLKKLGFN